MKNTEPLLFEIKHSGELQVPRDDDPDLIMWSNEVKILPVQAHHQDPRRLVSVVGCPSQKVWDLKLKLGEIFDAGHGETYVKVRDELFPQDAKGSSAHFNRAGDKVGVVVGSLLMKQLMEIVDHLKLFDWTGGTCFLDLCGGPGGFSQHLLTNAPQPCTGYRSSLFC